MTATVSSAPTTDCCLWCGRSYEARKDGGKRQRFCSPAHRRAFYHAAGLWMAAAIETGLVSRALLRKGLASNAALLLGSVGAPGPGGCRGGGGQRQPAGAGARRGPG